jgi:hypothetical protein
MIRAVIRRLLAIFFFAGLFLVAPAQTPGKDNKPYRILTSGKQITIRGTQAIKSVMVWTASGHRIIEQREVNASSFSFYLGVNEKIFFVMVEMQGERRYTEKIGIGN